MTRRGRQSDASRNVCAGLALVIATGAVATACARSAEERQLDTMREEIQELQQTQDRETARDPGDSPLPAATPVLETPPPLPLASSAVTLGGGAEAPLGPDDEADTEDTAPRPAIRVVGAARGTGRGPGRSEDSVEHSDPEEATSSRGESDRTTSLTPEAAHAYEAAQALVRARQFEKALDALAAFLVRWPDHPYADAAMYWRGECYFARGEYARAIEQLEGVLARYPEGTKVPDALLKLGMAEQKLGHADKAKDWFERLSQRFPDSAAARHLRQLHASEVQSPATSR
jgi:tol-pal system protein YbgF